MTTRTDDILATPADIASVLRCSERTVQRRAARGDIPSHRVGPQLVFTEDDVVQILGMPAGVGADRRHAESPVVAA